MKHTDTTDKATDPTDTDHKSHLLYEDLCYKIIGCMYDVRNTYGSGQKELVYQNALEESFIQKSIDFSREVPIKIKSRVTGKILGS